MKDTTKIEKNISLIIIFTHLILSIEVHIQALLFTLALLFCFNFFWSVVIKKLRKFPTEEV